MLTPHEAWSFIVHLFLTCLVSLAMSIGLVFGCIHAFSIVIDSWYMDLMFILSISVLATGIAAIHLYFLFESDKYLSFMKRILEK